MVPADAAPFLIGLLLAAVLAGGGEAVVIAVVVVEVARGVVLGITLEDRILAHSWLKPVRRMSQDGR
jgi:hypothetical protein